MPRLIAKLMPTIVFASTVFLQSSAIGSADQFYPRILAPAGGTIKMYTSPGQGYSGSITFPASNIPSGTGVNAHGYLHALAGFGDPPVTQVTLYSVVIGFDPKFTTSFSTSEPSTVTLRVPPSVILSKSLNMYEAEYNHPSSPPPPPLWNGPYVGVANGNAIKFTLPAHRFPGTTIVVLAVKQESAHDTSRELQSTNDNNNVARKDSQPHIGPTNFETGAVKSPPQPVSTQPPLSLVLRVCLRRYNDLHVDAFAYSNGYLLCNISDEYTGGQQVYKEIAPGRFKFVKGAGGMYDADGLATFAHVPLATAQVLVNSMASQLDSKTPPLPK